MSIANNIYARDQLPANVLGSIQPRSCIDANGQLVDTCLRPRSVISSVIFQRSPLPGRPPNVPAEDPANVPFGINVRLPALPPQKFFRLAFLADAAVDQQIYTQCDNAAGALSISSLAAQVTLDNAGVPLNQWTALDAIRSVPMWVASSCFTQGDGQPVSNAVYMTTLTPISPAPTPTPALN